MLPAGELIPGGVAPQPARVWPVILTGMGPAPITGDETIEAMLLKSQRLRVPLRMSFVQQGHGAETRPGLLAELVRNHDERGLDLYLLMMAVATAEPFKAQYEAATWARAVGLQGAGALTTVSRAWSRLAGLGLIERGRARAKIEGEWRRVASVAPLSEDGLRQPYHRPPGTPDDRYFALPVEYWLNGWHRRLPFAAKALLLVSLSLDRTGGFTLPAERAKDWYGVSEDTAERGLNKLREVGLIDRHPELKKAPLLSEGYVRIYRYALKTPFDKASLSRRRGRTREGVRSSAVTPPS